MPFAPIAIVGRGCVLPGALDPSALWEVVAGGRDLVGPAPQGRWRVDRDQVTCAPSGASGDRTWSDRGGYVRGFESVWDARGFGVSESELVGLDPLVLWALHAAREALREVAAGVRHGAGEGPALIVDPRTGAIFGNLGFPSERMAAFAESVWTGEGDVDPRNRFMSGGTADLLRRALGLGAGVFCLDAACASAIYAIKLACDRLHDGRADVMLAGAVQGADDLFLHVGFCALNALSRSGRSRPFHRDADGLLPAEGAAFVALKRLEDARRDGDTIHGVIRGIGLSNDGRGKGMLAPSEEGQQRAIRAAYAQAGIAPGRVSLLECHATGTPVGDATELRSTAAVFEGLEGVPLGSLKSNLGHLITASGAAGLIKILEAMRARQRPPTLHVAEPGDASPALKGSPFRLLTSLEPWDCDGPRIAALSAFGFGGNNAHLVVSEDAPERDAPGIGTGRPADAAAAGAVVPVALVGLGCIVAKASSRPAFTEALFAGESLLDGAGEGRMNPLELDLAGLRFPPKDLAQALPQQLAVLEASREAVAEAGSSSRERTGIFLGMEPDPEVARYGTRWRLAGKARDANASASWLARARDGVVPVLEAAAVIGTMPNIPANRLSSQLDLGGPAFTIQAGEESGLVALDLAARALCSGELDAALAGAVDLGCEPVHRSAAETLLPAGRKTPGDAAVVFVLKRLADAQRDGNRIYAILDEPAGAPDASGVADVASDAAIPDPTDVRLGTGDGAESLVPRFGNADAASALVHVAAAAIALHHRRRLDGRPWLSEGAGLRRATVRVASGAAQGLVEARGHAPRSEKGVPVGSGARRPSRRVEGKLAFVFTGAGAAYRGMGRDLLERLPQLGDALAARSRLLPRALAWSFETSDGEPTVLEQLWGASALCQLHVELTRGVLDLRPDAWLGYSSGETNALLASGTWSDVDALVSESESSGLFTRELGGRFAAVARAWGRPVRWASWTILAPVAEVSAALAAVERVHLAVVHTDAECVIAGEESGCDAVVARLGRDRCLRLGYPLAVHVPELDAVRDTWLALHRREVTPPAGQRIYSNALGGAYAPTSESCAQAILGQANRTLDVRPTVLAAWEDGVRVFVEHGPQAACGRWIRNILGEREAVIVSLDRKGQGIEATLDAVAALKAAGVPMKDDALDALLVPALGRRSSGRRLTFPSHPPPVAILPVTHGRAEARRESRGMQTMAPAPALPRVLDEEWSFGTKTAEVAVPQRIATLSVAAPPAESSVLLSFQAHVAQVSALHQEFVLSQQALHERFLSMRQAATGSLLHAARRGGASTTNRASAPGPAPVVAKPVATFATKPAWATPAPALVPEVTTVPQLPGPRFGRAELEVHAGGRISDLFGPAFRAQDGYARQVRMPLPPLLLADRVVGLAAEPASMGKGTIWTETDVRRDSWYLHEGYMPPGVMIEAGQADLMLISYLGVDLLNRGERVYRLLGCELTYHGDLAKAGDTLSFDIHLDGHAAQGDVRLMFFHYDCVNGGRRQLSVRKGQAGFFTTEELAASAGCLWSPETLELAANPRLDPPAVACRRTSLDREALEAFARGDAFACFGPGFELAQTHTHSPRIPQGRMLLQDRVSDLDPSGGPWGRGYLRAELDLRPDLWFFEGHFKNDPCMPGTLMFDGCLQVMALYLAAGGHTLKKDGWRFRPVPEIPYPLQCRGQATPASRRLVTEVFVEEIVAGPIPTLYADLLCTVDGLKAFHARRVMLELVPDWPLETMPELVAAASSDPRPVAEVNGFRFDHASLLACAWGRPSKAFGPMYERFDGPTRVARLPGPPYHFMSRIREVEGPIGVMKPGAKVVVDYDVPGDVWYFDENGCETMPFAVLLEAALQPCGWLSSYVGSALTVDAELGFRNLDGSGTVLGELHRGCGTLTTRVELTAVSATGGMIIETFVVRCSIGENAVYELKTVFGFFPPAALANQAGLPARDVHRELLARPSEFLVDLTARPAPFFAADRPRLAGPMLLMIDRIDGFWPHAGVSGLGQLRAVKDVDPGEWFFKAHFFQDPVQPGSLGIEAMIQALQFFMLETRRDEGIARPRFEALGVDRKMEWKYRGQVLPHHRTVHTTIEITEAGRDERGAFAVCDASLWADGQRIYEATGLGMRIVPGLPAGPRDGEILLDPAKDGWIRDHCPTWTAPALPMMSLVDLLARGSTGTGPVVAIRDVRVTGWLLVNEARSLRTECRGGKVRLLAAGPDGESEVANARVEHGAYGERPPALPPAAGSEEASPYETGALFHGPAFQVLKRLVMGRGESSSVLSAASGVPTSLLNPALLDGATHGIPHADLHTWNEAHDAGKVAYPAFIPEMQFFGPTPTEGTLRCEVREEPFLPSPDYPVFAVQLIGDDGVWSRFRLVESCFPKGPIGSAPRADRRAFLRDRRPVAGLRLSRSEDGVTLLTDEEVAGSDWLPGTVQAVFGSRQTEDVAAREHVAAAHALHPGRVLEQLPLTRFDLGVTRCGSEVRVSGDGSGRLDLAWVREFWGRVFDRGPWPVEDLFYGLIERFLERVVVEDPLAFAALKGRSVLYLANHQTGVESLVFSIVASALNGVPTVTLAKAEHRNTWLGNLIRHAFSYPGVTDPKVMTFFDREDRASLVRVIGELAAEMAGPGRSVMVHVEGTRSLSCRHRVAKMSGAFVDMALQVGVPVVPVRFLGGLPSAASKTRLEFPLGMGRQEIHLGRPLMPEELSSLHYGARKALVLDGINGLGRPNDVEEPSPGDPAFAARVTAWQKKSGVSHEHATLYEVLSSLPAPCAEVARLLTARRASELTGTAADARPEGRWLAELGRRLLPA